VDETLTQGTVCVTLPDIHSIFPCSTAKAKFPERYFFYFFLLLLLFCCCCCCL